LDFPRDPQQDLSIARRLRGSSIPASEAFSTREGLYAAATFARPDVRRTSVSCSRAWYLGPSPHQDTASATRVSLVIRSDARGMSHSANIGRQHSFGTGLAPSTLNTPTARWFQATATPFLPSSRRSTHTITTERLITLVGQLQPRFTLMVTHVGIDDGIDNRELGALDDRIGIDSPSRVGASGSALSCVSARPARLAAFSSS
jgi:hypothetical protein